MTSTSKDKLLNEAVARVERAYQDGEYGDSTVESAQRDFVDTLAAQTLWRLAPCVQALYDRCRVGADDAARAVSLGENTTIFAIDTEDPMLLGLAVQSGDDRFVTFQRYHADGQIRDISVAAWKPDMIEALAALPSPLPSDSQELVRLAERLAPYAAEGDAYHLAEISKTIAQSGTAPFRARVASLETCFHEAEQDLGAFTSITGRGVGEGFFRYAAIMADALPAAPAPEAQPRDKLFFDNWSFGAEQALALDGGIAGPVSREIFHTYRGRGFVCAARSQAQTLARNHDDMVAFGYVWGQRRLAYGDLDKRCFAIPTSNPHLSAFVHENIDLFDDANRVLVILHRDDAGMVERVEGHVVALPSPAIAFDDDVDVEAIVRSSVHYRIYEDPDATPPRLSQAAFVRRLQAGDPLPPAAVAVDLRTAEVSPETTSDRSGLLGYFSYIAQNDRWILDRIRNGEDRGIGCKDLTEFGDEDYELDATGPAIPGRL